MSDALAISGVTAVLQYFLNIAYNNPSSPLGGVGISAIAPDLVQISQGGAQALLQVNLFMHQVTHNAAWRNMGMPTTSPDGNSRLSAPPLALDLHYLLTAYAAEDTVAEALLGFAILLLHQNPILAREDIRTALSDLPNTNPLAVALQNSGLADQIEMIKIVPAVLGKEEMAWLWTALKADYRPTFPFQASVVLIEPKMSMLSNLPVLSRNITVQASLSAQLFSFQGPTGQNAPAPGDTVTLMGSGLGGTARVVLANPRLRIQFPPITPTQASDTSIGFVVPNAPATFPAGLYNLWVILVDPSNAILRSTNVLSFPVAPRLLPFAAGAAVNNAAGTIVTANFAPQVLPSQSVSLALGGMAAPAPTFGVPSGQLDFQFPLLASGPYLARLQVDGVDSPVSVNFLVNPPVFTGPFLNV
jgi:hypothetical protein